MERSASAVQESASSCAPAKKTKKKRNTDESTVNLQSNSASNSPSSRKVDTFSSKCEVRKKQKQKSEKNMKNEEEDLLIHSVSKKGSSASREFGNSLECEGERNEKRKKQRIREDIAETVVDSEKIGSCETNEVLDGQAGKRKKKRNRTNEAMVGEASPDSDTMPNCEENEARARPKKSKSMPLNEENGGTVMKCETDCSFTRDIRTGKDKKSKKKLGSNKVDDGSAHQQIKADSRNERDCPSGIESGRVPKTHISNSSPRSREEGNLLEDEDKNNFNSNKKKKKKKVSFEDQHMEQASDEVDADGSIMNDGETEIWGIRFTPEEDEILKQSVFKYIKERGWEENEGLEKVLNCKQYKEAKNCWSDIKTSLPCRPRSAIRLRAHLLLEEGTHLGRWSKDEEELLKSLYGKHGTSWKRISRIMGRDRTSIKEKWRTLKRGKSAGKWSQQELQQLSDLVHKCYRIKALIGLEKKSNDRHILKDDINWQKIADDIGTHGHGACCGKWYYNLCSSMVSDGIWANEDDFLLLKSLLESGACAEEEVEWNKLLTHRAGSICLTRWKQMGKHLGENISRPFLDKLDLLVKRYAPELLENADDEQESLSGFRVS